MPMAAHQAAVEKFKATFLEDDLDGFMELIDPVCEWTLMATGERFSGVPEIRKLAERSMAARHHTREVKMEPVALFATAQYFAAEYLHRAIVTADWPSSTHRPAPGTTLAIPICIVARFKGERFDQIHEYFDLATVQGKGGQKLYS
jgi:hypothetical protein